MNERVNEPLYLGPCSRFSLHLLPTPSSFLILLSSCFSTWPFHSSQGAQLPATTPNTNPNFPFLYSPSNPFFLATCQPMTSNLIFKSTFI